MTPAPDNERTRDAVKRSLYARPFLSKAGTPGELERRLLAGGRLRSAAGLKYALEHADIALGLGRTTHTKGAERCPPAQRPAVERIVRDELLAGGWPGHVAERIDARLDAEPEQGADVVPISAAHRSSAATAAPPPTVPPAA